MNNDQMLDKSKLAAKFYDKKVVLWIYQNKLN